MAKVRKFPVSLLGSGALGQAARSPEETRKKIDTILEEASGKKKKKEKEKRKGD
jgi:hypothetical protein